MKKTGPSGKSFFLKISTALFQGFFQFDFSGGGVVVKVMKNGYGFSFLRDAFIFAIQFWRLFIG